MHQSFKEIYAYREMLVNLIRRDLRTRYKGSALGFLWTFINPLLQLIVYSVVFSFIMRMNVVKYPMFLFVALLPWIYFANTTQSAANLIISNGNIIKKVYFPREILPLATATAGLINLALSLIVALIALLVFRIPLGPSLIALPLIMILQFFFTLGITFIVSAVNVYYRDVEHVWGILLMAWFYVTPIVYPLEMIPENYMRLFSLNPATLMINSYRDILYKGIFPNPFNLLYFAIFSFLILCFGYLLFRHLARRFAEEV